MNWMIILDRIIKKPPVFVLPAIGSLFLLLMLKWQLTFPFETLWFFLGGVTGMYVLDIAEGLYSQKSSPFRSILFVITLFVLSFYVITSTKEYLAKGLALMLYMQLSIHLLQTLKHQKNVTEWFRLLIGEVTHDVEKTSVIVVWLGLILLHILFIVS